jgi:Mg2+/citrate symporter
MSTKTYTEIPNEQKRMNKKREKKSYNQTSRLENPEEPQLHHNNEKNIFLNVLLLSAKFKKNDR